MPLRPLRALCETIKNSLCEINDDPMRIATNCHVKNAQLSFTIESK
jgi:hypothetical protein